MNVVFAGSKNRGVACLKRLVEHDAEVISVVTQSKSDPNKFWTGSVSTTAREFGIPIHSPTDINDPSFVSKIAELDPNLIVLSGYSQILGSEILDLPTHGVINLHAGKLPEYRGGSPMNWAILNGEKTITATIHYARERVDAGSVLAEETYELEPDETIEDVRQWTLTAFPELLVDVVTDIQQGTEKTREFDVSNGTYWGSRKPQDGHIKWQQMTAREVHDRVRALTDPYPGAFSWYGDEKLIVWDTECLSDTVKHESGRVCMARNGGRVVAAADRGLLVKTVQPEGKERQSATTYLSNGDYLE